MLAIIPLVVVNVSSGELGFPIAITSSPGLFKLELAYVNTLKVLGF